MSFQPPRIAGASFSIFSLARIYGGCKIHGTEYVYEPETDELHRIDVWKEMKRQERLRKRLVELAQTVQGDLFAEVE
jgi:hypothetical protein